MGFAFFYFSAKLFLFGGGHIRLDIVLNLLFLAFLFGSAVYTGRPGRGKPVKYASVFISLVLGLLLLWHDSWLPSPAETYSLLKAHGLPSAEYIADFASRFFAPKAMLVLGGLLAVSLFIRRFTRTLAGVLFAALVAAAFLIPGASAGVDGADLDEWLSDFYEEESARVVYFNGPSGDTAPFDIILVNICSIAREDLDVVGLSGHPLFRRFDYFFENFNSVSTYSNPAVIRLFNSGAGQTVHAEMYDGLPKEYSLFANLKEMGYDPFFLMNHNGTYGHFLDETRRLGNMTGKVIRTEGLKARVEMFDGSPVYGDYEALAAGWKAMVKARPKRAAVFYNTVTLHDGCRPAGGGEAWKKDPEGTYAVLLRGLLDDTVKFMDLLEASGRRVVVVFIPEHGRALRGTAMQVAGLRDIPLPGITNVPVGVALIGKRSYRHEPQTLRITEPTSFLALAQMLADFVEKNPFVSPKLASEVFIRSLPSTPFVSENEENIVIGRDGRFFLKDKTGEWSELPPASRGG